MRHKVADAYKCFDKLNLKDCINDYYKIMGEKEAMRIYEINKKCKAVIKTPLGDIGPIEGEEVVKQCTILGPKLCSINTDKVNLMGNSNISTIGPRIKTKSLIYVDDIQNTSSNVTQLEKTVENLKGMEETKGYTFNIDPTKTAILIINK